MAKGQNFERDISKYLTKWLTGTTKPYVFWRNDGSGSFATRDVENAELAGDLKALRREGDFFREYDPMKSP